MSIDGYDKMVIDLTEDSDPEEHLRVAQLSAFFPSLAQRAISPSIPQKRKSERTSEAETAVPLSNGQNQYHDQPNTPSPAPETPIEEFKAVSVVVPSPSAQLRREINSAEWITDVELTGLSKIYYPVDAHERRATKGAYPSAKKIKRLDVPPFLMRQPGPFLIGRRPTSQQLRESLRRKLETIKGPRVSVATADELLLAQATTDFEFINQYKLRKGVTHINKEFLGGCTCKEVCNPERCTCLTLEIDSNTRIVPYRCADDNKRLLLLSQGFMSRTSMIYECNSLCSCDYRCWNRVVQQGRLVRLEIFHTGNRGFEAYIAGLRSPDRLRAGQFIDLYLGEVLTKEAADAREEISAATKSHSYLFGLDFLVDDEEIYVVDGQRFGATTRFINHSCNPNCRMFAVSRTHGDQNLYDLAFFSLKEIPPMTELTFDYNPAWEKTAEVDPTAVPCLCGEKNCRGQLWPSERKKTK